MTGEWKSSFYSNPACHSISVLLTWQLLPPDHCYMSQIKYWCNRAINIFLVHFICYTFCCSAKYSKRLLVVSWQNLTSLGIIGIYAPGYWIILSRSDCQACLKESYNWVTCGSVLTRNKNWQFSLIWLTGSIWFNQFIMLGRPFPSVENQFLFTLYFNAFYIIFVKLP